MSSVIQIISSIGKNPSLNPVANFSQSGTTGTSPYSVTFTDTSTNNPTSWLWDFGDGTTSTSQNPTHIYYAAGTFTVSLTATNAAGSNKKTVSNLISVGGAFVGQAVTITGGGQLKNLAYGNGVWVAVRANAAANGDTFVSSNGTSWTGYTGNVPGFNYQYSLASNGTSFAIGMNQGANAMAYTSDGVSWGSGAFTGTPLGAGNDMAYGNGRYIALCGGGRNLMSTDGVNWTRYATTTGLKMCYASTRFVIVNTTTTSSYTTDGITYTAGGAIPAGLSSVVSVGYGNGVVVAMGANQAVAVSSDQGASWTTYATALPSTGSWRVGFGNGIFLAVSNGSNKAATSTDGITWTARTLPSTAAWNIVKYGGNSRFMVVSDTTAAVLVTAA